MNTKRMSVSKRRERSVAICITVERDGVWFYGNAPAFRELAKQFGRLANSPPSNPQTGIDV